MKFIFVRSKDLDRFGKREDKSEGIDKYGIAMVLDFFPKNDERYSLHFDRNGEDYFRVVKVDNSASPHSTYFGVVYVEEVKEEFDS